MKPFNESNTISGNFVTYYKGNNYAIRATKYQLFSQQISIIKSLRTLEYLEEKMCFEFTLMDKNYLMVLDYERLYKVVKSNETKKYNPLQTSVFMTTDKKEDGLHFLIRGKLQFFINYGEGASFFESFDFQLIFDNDPVLVEELKQLNNNEFEF
ncbi:hypothetical protein [Flavobacterium sp.]|uniref:hypothetical protein n=1 Tax=Flavobacterium sp. TaxID=239 RepID=UPI002620718C|nr:hypothetical protein [Flavobacterium sp.]MDD3004559.1 hypothetical protein [Flavobacterium sp.]